MCFIIGDKMIEIFPPKFDLIQKGDSPNIGMYQLSIGREEALRLTKQLIEELRRTIPLEDLLQELNLI